MTLSTCFLRGLAIKQGYYDGEVQGVHRALIIAIYSEIDNPFIKHTLEFILLSFISCPKNISAVKKGKSKKVQVAERLKDVISL